MRVLITGATGFIGSCLARRLIQAGHEVHIFLRQTSNRWRVEDIRKELHEHVVDLRDLPQVEGAVGNSRPEIIYHCATYGGFADQKDTQAILKSNFLGTVNLFRACERAGFEYFVNTGSSSEYGIKTAPMDEEDMPKPLDDYGVSKAAAALFCGKEGKNKMLPVVTLRLFSPFGPWDDPRRLVPYAIKSFLRGEAPRLSTPASVRDYVFIEDVLDAYLQVIKKPFFGEIFNIGSGTQHSIGDVVSTIRDIVHGGPAPLWGSEGRKRTEPETWVANVTKAKSLLYWQAATGLRNGLERTINWMQEHIDLYL